MPIQTSSIIPPDQLPRRDDAVAGVLWMLLSCALLSGVAALGRYAVLAGMSPFQVVFLRLLFAVIALSPVLVWRGPSMLQTSHLPLYAVRVTLGLIGMTAWFLALALWVYLVAILMLFGAEIAAAFQKRQQRLAGLRH